MRKAKLCAIKYKQSNVLFLLAYSILIFYRILKSSTFGFNDYGISYILISLLFLSNILVNKMKVIRFLIAIVLLSVAFLHVIHSYDPVVPVVFLALISAENVYYDDIVKQSFIIMVPMVIAILLFALFGFIPDTISYRFLGSHEIACHGAGFNHSSALPTYYCFIFLEYCYLLFLKRKRISFIASLIWLIGGLFIFLLCAERLRFCLLLFIIVLNISERVLFQKNTYKFWLFLMSLLYPFCAIVKWVVGYYYNPENRILWILNILLSNRLYLENYSFKNYSIRIFGQRLAMGDGVLLNLADSYFYLDSAYVYMLFVYGVPITLIILFAFIFGARKSVKTNNYIIMIWFFVIGIDSLVGNQMLSLWSMPVLFVPFCQCKRIVNISRKALPVGIKTDEDSIIWQKLHDNRKYLLS